MRRLIHILIAGLALVTTMGAAAGTAAGLPTLLFLPGESGPVTFLSLVNTFATEFQTAEFHLTGEGVAVVLSFPTPTSNLGTFKMTFAKVEDPQQENLPCDTAGAGAGNVVLMGSVHLVYDSLTVLGVAGLLLFEEVIIACEGAAVRLKGNALGLLKPINREILTTEEAELVIHCSEVAGTPEERKWWNGAGVEQTALMEMRFPGLLFERGCIDVANPVKLKPTRMVEIMG